MTYDEVARLKEKLAQDPATHAIARALGISVEDFLANIETQGPHPQLVDATSEQEAAATELELARLYASALARDDAVAAQARPACDVREEAAGRARARAVALVGAAPASLLVAAPAAMSEAAAEPPAAVVDWVLQVQRGRRVLA